MTDHENVGYMAWEEFARFRRAVHRSPRIIAWLRVAGYIRSGEPDEIRAPSSNHPLGVSPTWLAAEEITRLSRELQWWPDLEDIANDHDGVETARLFTREVETADHRWPYEDRTHKVKFLRCQECSGETLRYTPPEYDGDDIRIACTECGATVTEDEFKTLAMVVALEMQKAGGDDSRRLGAA